MINSVFSSKLCLGLIIISFPLNAPYSLQQLYSKARQVRTLQGHEQALPLFQEILTLNPSDVTAATRVAADERSAKRHDRFGKGGDQIQRVRFTELLQHFDFDCNSIADLVFATNPTKATKAKRSSTPLFLKPLRAGAPPPPLPTCELSACVQLLLLSVCLPTKNCIDLLGNEFVELLQTLGLAYNLHDKSDRSNSLLVPYAHVFPVTVSGKTIYLCTDLHPNVLSLTTIGTSKNFVSRNGDGDNTSDGAVMYIGPDSLALLDHWSCLQRVKETDNIVDVGCGSGIQALALVVRSSGYRSVKCVDINERALRITRFNFELNNFDKPTLILGNICQPTGKIFESNDAPKPWKELLGESTTYLVSNPPFLPVPLNYDTIASRYGLFSNGGSSGEDFLQSLITLASEVLDRHDTCAALAVVSEFMNPAVDFDLRLSSWWKNGYPASALLFTNEAPLDAVAYAERRADSLDEVAKWEGHLQQEGIQYISPGLMFLKHGRNACDSRPLNETKTMIRNSQDMDLAHYLIPTTPEGSIWTPTNLDARDLTRGIIKKFFRQ
mmetsp:Transcript_4544/g.11724  ORF Transcript_4544/g.11724 Transcript_4544/m.11724 type:complete len:553 (-) Transcript_4544:1599-3257(-)|eukprot:CAMPEP_0197179692 /NCGR_PEP_ID=MMETSP1423-20130617/4553_1 /TAXON_ID=476441 /ORGANISM="Pseudo-nitzschia heimii, Strain UNC1101" /LENGTH=552 /DNA_ID=CAMNT_0042629635 /DNA_START=36 /DNA_END=1694 /DNA_ORIENTATION=-